MTNNSLYTLEASNIWAYIKTQDILFWLINIYLFMEYVRPQTLYPALDILPYGKIILIMAFVILVFKKIPVPTNSANKLIVLFTLIVILSSVTAISPAVSFDKISDYLVWVLIYFLITTIVNSKERLLVFILCFLVYSFKMSQFSFKNWVVNGFGFSSWGTGGGPGWFHNSGEFGIQMCVFLPLSLCFVLALKEHWQNWKKILFFLFPVTALSSTISCSSRGALVGAGAVIFWLFLKSRYKIKGVFVLVLISVLVWYFIPPEQKTRFISAGDDKTSVKRTERWKKGLEMANRYPVLGVGYANWEVADRLDFGGNGALSHNIFIQCLSELGYIGLVAFLLLVLATFINNKKTREMSARLGSDSKFMYYMAHGFDAALIGYLASGFFVTVFYYPFFWINLSMTVALNNCAILACCETSKCDTIIPPR